MRLLFISVLALGLCGCGLSKKFSRLKGQTNVKLQSQRGGANLTSTLNGGVFIYAVRADNPDRRASKFLANESQSLIWSLENGPYRFFALGYEETNLNSATNRFRCGKSQVVNLTGVDVTVPLSLSYANCADEADFQMASSYAGANNQALPFLLVTCAGGGGKMSSLTSVATFNTCDGGPQFTGTPNLIARDPVEGKLYVAGSASDYAGTTIPNFVRLNRDGTIDSTFSGGTGFDAFPSGMMVLSSGKLLVWGDFTTYRGTVVNRLVRINDDGTIDSAFNVGAGADAVVATAFEMPNGQIVIGGDFTTYDSVSTPRIARINTDGTRDATLVVGTGFTGGQVNGIDVDSGTGTIYVVGAFSTYNTSNSAMKIAKISSTGSYVGTYGAGISGGVPNGIKRDSTGKLWVWGSFANFNSTTPGGLTRFDPATGTVDANIQAFTGMVNGVHETSTGKFVVFGGFTQYNSVTVSRGLARLNADCTTDATFNAVSSGVDATKTVAAAVLDDYNNAVLVGNFLSYGPINASGIVRVNNMGGTDSYFSGARPRPSNLVGGLKISLLEYDLLNGVSLGFSAPRIQSACIINASQGSQTGSNVSIPSGTLANAIFGFGLETFDDAGCSGSTNHAFYHVPGGLAEANVEPHRISLLNPPSGQIFPYPSLFRHIPDGSTYNWFFFREVQ